MLNFFLDKIMLYHKLTLLVNSYISSHFHLVNLISDQKWLEFDFIHQRLLFFWQNGGACRGEGGGYNLASFSLTNTHILHYVAQMLPSRV